MDGMSLDIAQTNKEKLKAVFPECFSEGVLDIDKLLSLCGEFISNDFEKYKFEWKGKTECLQLAKKRSTGTLRPVKSDSVNFDATQNVYIKGDNLEVLKLLQTAYYRKVKMIYIDPPYNTGNDFVYEDDFADPMSKYKEVTQQTTKSNPETMGRFHTNWLNMMYPRLMLAANLLTDDGVIFISIDDNEVTNLRKVCDEVFGEENFVAQIIWERAFAPKNDAKFLSSSHDYILVYAKSLSNFEIGRLPRTEEANSRYKNPDNDPRGAWTSGDLSVKTYNSNTDYEITTPSGKIVKAPHGSCWRVSKERFQELVADNRIWFGEKGDNVPRLKRFLSEIQDGMVATTLWQHKEVGHNQEGRQELKKLFDDKGYFDGPKPIRLMERILKIANVKENDIILDFFSGSATTAHAVMKLNAEDGGNRRFICVQLPELCNEKSEAYKAGYKTICDIGIDRIKRAGQKILSETENAESLDIGFKVFELDTSNLKTWDSTLTLDDYEQEEIINRMENILSRVKPDRSSLDMVYEIMLKIGKPLTDPVKAIELDGKTAYTVGEDCKLIICLAKDITPEYLEKLCELKPEPSKLVIGKDGLYSDSAMSNALYICQDRNIELKLI